MKKLFIITFILGCLLFNLVSFAQEEVFISTIQSYGKRVLCKISWVDDGDTFNLSCSDGNYSNVRLLGMNAPDKDIANNRESCYYSKAKEYVEARKKHLYVAIFYGSDLCKDSYKGCRNLVRLVDVRNSADFGQSMILNGLAFSWTNFSMVPTEVRGLYDWMERIASRHQIGLWRDCEVQRYSVPAIDSPDPDKATSIVERAL